MDDGRLEATEEGREAGNYGSRGDCVHGRIEEYEKLWTTEDKFKIIEKRLDLKLTSGDILWK